MFQFLKRHIIKASSYVHRGGRHCHFGVAFQIGGEGEWAFFAFFTLVSRKHTKNPSVHLHAIFLSNPMRELFAEAMLEFQAGVFLCLRSHMNKSSKR